MYLRDVNLGCFLSVEGIISEDLVGVRNIKDLQDSLFCIHLQRQYSAYRELNVFLEGYGMDKSKITDEGELSYYQALEVCLLYPLMLVHTIFNINFNIFDSGAEQMKMF